MSPSRVTFPRRYNTGTAERTVRFAARVVPLYEAEIVTVVEKTTIDVFTVKVALVAPAGMVTLPGTAATPGLLLESVTNAPPAGAGPFSLTVPAEDSRPPTTLVGFRLSEERVGAGAITVSEAVCVTPPKDAEMVTEVVVPTGLVLTVKVVVVAPLGTVTLDGTVATPGLLLDRDTRAPPLGAGPLSVTVPVDELPPVTLVGVKARESRVTAWPGVVVIRAETVGEEKLATARSGIRSPLKSATATEEEPKPPPKVSAGRNVPSPLPSSTETMSEPKSATATSWTPSPLKSPTATDDGLMPAATGDTARKVPSPLPSSTETVLES